MLNTFKNRNNHNKIYLAESQKITENGDTKLVVNILITKNSFEKNKKHELLVLDGLIDNHKMKVAIECGASSSILSTASAMNKKIRINEYRNNITLADGSIIKADGITDELQVSINGITTYLQFIVMKHDDHDAILGVDYLVETGDIISLRDRYKRN